MTGKDIMIQIIKKNQFPTKIKEIGESICPCQFGLPESPRYCSGTSACRTECDKCWKWSLKQEME